MPARTSFRLGPLAKAQMKTDTAQVKSRIVHGCEPGKGRLRTDIISGFGRIIKAGSTQSRLARESALCVLQDRMHFNPFLCDRRIVKPGKMQSQWRAWRSAGFGKAPVMFSLFGSGQTDTCQCPVPLDPKWL